MVETRDVPIIVIVILPIVVVVGIIIVTKFLAISTDVVVITAEAIQ